MEQNCVFCRIARDETDTEILHANEQVIVFRDIRPQAPVHLLIVPRRHIRSVNDLAAEDAPILGELFRAAQEMARRLNIARDGYRLFVNVERGGGQVIFHLHMHLIGGWGR
ncbi:MAG: histidine triad nucleotide-binding protein [Desulfobacterales bacterium]|jgi:histidine triad (HIT) family protein|nr:histidine triad nucleotide-binding protein [Desulfobacterales bacterium]